MRFKQILFVNLAFASLYGCTNVEPYERSFLAQDQMQLDPNELDTKFRRHVYFAREGTQGGYGAEVGECGCN